MKKYIFFVLISLVLTQKPRCLYDENDIEVNCRLEQTDPTIQTAQTHNNCRGGRVSNGKCVCPNGNSPVNGVCKTDSNNKIKCKGGKIINGKCVCKDGTKAINGVCKLDSAVQKESNLRLMFKKLM